MAKIWHVSGANDQVLYMYKPRASEELNDADWEAFSFLGARRHPPLFCLRRRSHSAMLSRCL
jgi:hypothetical protein